ncbi:polar amino acid ABC transporter permease [Listeria monocytogenes]|uniref:Amino acid ABC transporter permease n=1 Tax=Listeria monocytogenes TaxID=1639 RepID=A0A823ISF4_LISMN|nr:amino acid ABC transporter permease [Listeria monocytogenes]EAG9222986.1 amino acid ABC transporter permease [Listeria monocytogenes]EAG9223169.1 amino acid ABC transporter permease [Listeria monocytogenes]EAG9354947.1 amino acid ABC transporter permease [Listeria monocytogenes]EAG9355169.1 amino acid ABC transporter permease [Listeria monocytogenes]OET19904.1 polar amino acid ABC transporter permease [Listeria monocytogenes]
MDYIMEIVPALLDGVKTTLLVFIVTLACSIPLGAVVAVGNISKIAPLKFILNIYIWIMRGTPLLLQLIFIYYGLPIIGVVFDRMDAVFIAFILNYAAYFAEIFRGGFLSIENGQYESAKVLGLTYGQTLRKIVLPQVVKRVLPAIGNEVINLVKDSSLVYILGIGDLLRAGKIAMSRDVTLIPLVLVAAIYLALTAVLTVLFKQLEKRFSYYK